MPPIGVAEPPMGVAEPPRRENMGFAAFEHLVVSFPKKTGAPKVNGETCLRHSILLQVSRNNAQASNVFQTEWYLGSMTSEDYWIPKDGVARFKFFRNVNDL